MESDVTLVFMSEPSSSSELVQVGPGGMPDELKHELKQALSRAFGAFRTVRRGAG